MGRDGYHFNEQYGRPDVRTLCLKGGGGWGWTGGGGGGDKQSDPILEMILIKLNEGFLSVLLILGQVT